MPKPPRADEAGGLYHALNRANMRATIFHKEGDFVAFEKILHEALEFHEVELFSYQLMPNHYHLVLRPLIDGEMSRFMGRVGGTHTMRYHAHYHTSGKGTFTSSGLRVFRFRTTATSRSFAGTSNAMHCAPAWSNGPKIGGGDRCGVGCKSRNLSRNYYRPGRSRGCPTGSSE